MSRQSRILVVGGGLQGPLFSPLERDGFEVVSVTGGSQALDWLKRDSVDLVVLDAPTPTADGLDICRRLRARSPVPIIMLSAQGSDLDKVHGLETGADDYITKPVSALEFRSRVRAILRRAGPARPIARGSQPVKAHGLVIDFQRHSVLVEGRETGLTRLEFDLLAALAESAGRALSRGELLDRIWGDSRYRDPRAVDVHIRHLREKIEPDPETPQIIVTVRGVGYRFREFEPEA